MGADYYIYTEVKINDKWISIDPLVPKLVDTRKSWRESHKYNGEVEYEHQLTYWNGSRSYFGETFDKLGEIGYTINFADLSDEVKEHWAGTVEAEANGERMYAPPPVCVDYEKFKRYVDVNRFDYHRLVHKDQWTLYKAGEIEDLYGVDHDAFVELTPEERQCYEYHEWDEPMGWNTYFKHILKCVEKRIIDFEDVNNIWGDSNMQYRIVAIISV